VALRCLAKDPAARSQSAPEPCRLIEGCAELVITEEPPHLLPLIEGAREKLHNPNPGLTFVPRSE